MKPIHYITIMIVTAGLMLSANKYDLPVVAEVTLDKYAGKWYEITSFPQRFQKNCSCTEANYSIRTNGKIKVYNSCFNTAKQKWEHATGTASVVKNSNNARLKVQFFWPFKGDYYIIALEKDYSHVMIGGPDRKYLWILSRDKKGDPEVIDRYKKRATELGFDISRLKSTDQNCDMSEPQK